MDYNREYVIKFAAKSLVVIGMVADTLYFVLTANPVGIVLVPLNIAAVVAQFIGPKPIKAQAQDEVNYYQETAELNSMIEVGMPRLQSIPEYYFDCEEIRGDQWMKWWLYYVMIPDRDDPLISWFQTYLLDPFAKYNGSNRVVDFLRIEIRSMPQKRIYTALKLTAKADILELVDKLKAQGVTNLNAGELFKATEESRTGKLESAAAVMTMKNK